MTGGRKIFKLCTESKYDILANSLHPEKNGLHSNISDRPSTRKSELYVACGISQITLAVDQKNNFLVNNQDHLG